MRSHAASKVRRPVPTKLSTRVVRVLDAIDARTGKPYVIEVEGKVVRYRILGQRRGTVTMTHERAYAVAAQETAAVERNNNPSVSQRSVRVNRNLLRGQ